MNIYNEIDGLLLQILPDVYRTVKVVPTGSQRPAKYIVWREINIDYEMSDNEVYANQHYFSVSIFGKTELDSTAIQISDLLNQNEYVKSNQRDLDYDNTTEYYGKYLEFYKIV